MVNFHLSIIQDRSECYVRTQCNELLHKEAIWRIIIMLIVCAIS